MKVRNLVLGCMLVLVIALVFAILGVVTVSSYKVENVAFATNPYATYNDIYITVRDKYNIYTRSISEFDKFSLAGHLDYNTSTGTLTINDWNGDMKGIDSITVRGNEPKDITIDFKCSPTFVLNEVEYGVEYSNFTPGGNLTLTSTEARTVNINYHVIRSGGELTFKGNLSAKVTGSDYTIKNPVTQKYDSANNNYALKVLENSSYISINPFPLYPTNDQQFDAYKDKRSLFQNVEFTINTTGKVEIGFQQGASVGPGRVGKQRIMRNCPINFVKCDGGFYLYHEDSDIEYSYSLPDNTIDKSFWNAYSTNSIAGYSCGGKYLEPLNQDYFKNTYRIIIAITKVVSKVKNITFNANGGSGSMSATVTDNDGNYTLPENEFTPPDDYTFAGWLVNSGSGDLAYKKGEELYFDSDVVLYPKWIETIHDFYEVGYADGVTNVVSYVVQEGTHFELMSYDDTGLTMPLGKHFAGWSDWYNGKTVYEEGYEYTMPDENLVFVATYDDNPGEVPVTITYDKNGGTGDYGPFEILDGEQYELPLNMFGEPANQDFKCWNINGTNYNPGDVITISGNTCVNAVWFTKDSLYANYDGTVRLGEQLSIDNLTVAFYYEDGSMVDIYPLVDVNYYLGVQNIDNILLYDFDEGGAIDITIKYKKDESFSTIMRVYVKILVSFDSNGGSGAMSSTEQWGDYILPANTFTAPANKQFKGWSLTSNGDVISTAAINVSEDTTLYAIWEDIPEETYTVSFGANGGTGTMTPVDGVNGSYTLPANGFTAPQGKQFKCWSVGGVEKAVGSQITVSENTTVTAVWEDIPAQDPEPQNPQNPEPQNPDPEQGGSGENGNNGNNNSNGNNENSISDNAKKPLGVDKLLLIERIVLV